MKFVKAQDFSEPVKRAYEWANQKMLTLLMTDKDLLGRLRSLKNSFFFAKSDYFVHFLDSAGEELGKDAKLVSKDKIESLLELALRTSTMQSDLYMEDIRCCLLT